MPISIHGTSSTLEKTFPKQCMQELHLKLRAELFAQMHAQLAARHQAEESQEAVKDILNWSRKQKEKDRAISRAAASGKNTRTSELKPADCPEETSTYHEDFVKEPVTQHSEPVTGSPLPSQAHDLRGNGRQVSKPGGKAMKGFLKKPSSQVQTAKVRLVGLPERQPGTSEQQQQPLAPQTAAERVADGERLQGNEAYKRGDLIAAEAAYTRSLGKHASAAAFANRAMVRLKKEDWLGAEEDCTAALDEDSLYLKAWQRRGTARRHLKKHLEAAQDFEEALRLEPSSTSNRLDRDQCLETWKAETKPEPPKLSEIYIEGCSALKGTSASPEKETLLQPVKHVTEGTASEPHKAGQSVAKLDTRETRDASLLSPSNASSTQYQQAVQDSLGQPALQGNGRVQAAADAQKEAPDMQVANQRPVQGLDLASQAFAGLRNSSGQSALSPTVIGKGKGDASSASGNQNQVGGLRKQEGNEQGSSSVKPLEDSVAEQLAALGVQGAQPLDAQPMSSSLPAPERRARISGSLKPPQTGTDFEKVWRGLKGDLAGQAEYLKLLDEGNLVPLFKTSLTGATLVSIVAAALHNESQGVPALQLLEKLPQLPRFRMATMSIPSTQRQTLRQLWVDTASSSACANPKKLLGLQAAYVL